MLLSLAPKVPGVEAATLFSDGFESGDFSAWTGTSQNPNSPSPDYTMLVPEAPELAHHGNYFAVAELLGGTASYCYKTLTASELYVRGYFQSHDVEAIADNGDRFFFITFRASGGNNLAYAGWRNENGVVKWILTLRDGTGYVDVYSSNSPTEGVYTSVELHWRKGTDNGGADLWVDGVNVCSSWGRNTASYGDIQSVRIGVAETYNCGEAGASFDCIAFSTSYIGPEPKAEPSNLSITGMVYYSTYPLDGVLVKLFQGNDTFDPLQATSTINGYYRFSALAPGSYDITAYGPTSEYAYGTGFSGIVVSSNVTRDIDLPKLMTLRSPGKEANTTSLHPTLSWDANSEAARYAIQINVVDGWQLVEVGHSTSTSYTVQTELTPGVRYTWQVDAFDAYSHHVGTTHTEHYLTVVRPEHDLSVTLDTSVNAFPSTRIVNATVQNLGLSNESDIIVRFFVNGGLTTSKTISFLQNGSTTRLGFPWPSPSMLGTYNVTVYVVPVPGEDSENNRATNSVTVYADSPESPDDWPMSHHDPEHTGYSTTTAPETNYLWKRVIGSEVVSSPAIVDGRLYVGSSDHNIYCLNTSTGTTIWSFITGSYVQSDPAVSDGRVYVGSDYSVYCLNASTGNQIWCYETGGSVYSSPAILGNRVYIGSNDNNVYCLNAITGSRIWSYLTGNWVISSPAVSNNKVYVGSNDHNFYCLNASTGTLKWTYTTVDDVISSPLIINDKVYVGSDDFRIYCLNANTGAKIWSYTTGNYVESSPATFGGRVYVGSADYSVYCLNATTGAKIWSYATNDYALCSPAIADGRVYIGSDDHNIYCLNAYTGTKIWSYTTGDDVSSTAVAGGVLYLGSFDGSVYAFGGPAHLIPTTLACSISSSQVSKGGTISVSGFITPAVAGQLITLTYTRPNGYAYTSWSTCHSDGSYSHSYNPDTAGPWSVTVSWMGNATHSGASTSKSFTVNDTVDLSAFPTTYIIAGAGAVTAIAVSIYLVTKRREAPPMSAGLKLARPSGVTVLVVLEILVGLVLLGGGAIFAFLSSWIGESPFIPSEFNIPIAAMSWGIFVVAGLVSFIEVFGMWRGSRWAWILGLILAGLGIILGITSLPTGIVYIAIQANVIYYLTRPHVRQFLGRTSS
jgi:outer membrane protein assembly factor BamB